MSAIKTQLEQICARQDLSEAEAAAVFTQLVEGALSDVEISALLIALKTKGEALPEIVGAAQALRQAALPFPSPEYDFADCVGTGGDGLGTVNISTAATFVAAQLGLPMVKHGNRSVSSKCGSSDVLAQLGVKIDAPPELSRKALDEARVCFLFAPVYHSGLRHAAPARGALKLRTIMNVLGPLVNPARPPLSLIGVYDPVWTEPLARVMGDLGSRRALLVHGARLDEVALHGQTLGHLWADGALTEFSLTPEEVGLERAPLEALKGAGPEGNARWLSELLSGRGEPAHLDAVALNAGVLMWAAGQRSVLREAVAEAKDCLSSGAPIERLKALVEISNG